MTPGERRFGRRALLVGTAGAASAIVAYEVIRLKDGETDPAVSPAGPVDTVDQSGQPVDLTVRWRHLERRVEDPDLLAGWQFDEGAGYAFVDVSGHRHTLHVTGLDWNTTDSGLASAIHRRGSRGGAVHLNRTRWLAAAPVADLVPRAGLTLSCRLRTDVMPLSEAVLVAFGTSYALTLSATGALTLTVEDRAGSQRMVRTPPRAVTPGEWIQISATAAPRTGTLRLYVDGELVSHVQGRPFALRSKIASLVVGGQFDGDVDELAIHRIPLSSAEVQRLHVLGLPKVFTQTSESIDAERSIFTHFKGSDPIPHPATKPTRLTHRFAASTRTEQGVPPLVTPRAMTFVPGAFGAAWPAASERLTYPSPLSGDSGTFEAWYRTTEDARDPRRQRRKEIFAAAGPSAGLVLFTESGRWQVEVRRRGGRTDTLAAPSHPFLTGVLEHIAVSWGEQTGAKHGVALYVNGVPAGLLPTLAGETSYSWPLGLGGRPGAPTDALIDDVRICDTALPWGEICPRGHASTEAAGLDLRDRFDRPPGAAPLLWRPGSPQAKWSHRNRAWERPAAVGADPDSIRALYQGEPTGLHPVFHPDAFGHASSIEAGVAFPAAVDGWAGVFVQAPQPHGAFSGLTFMLNPHQGRLRLARFESGRATASKLLVHDFPVTAHATYELTLTSPGNGLVRGFVDGTNVISMRVGAGWPDRGYAGLLTDGSQAFFSDLHFCALTPPSPSSRVIRTNVIRYGDGAAVAKMSLVPFRWHKRRGLLPWQYTFKDPEPAGNIAGAATPLPLRPIGSATWRSEDSANSDLITVAGQVLFVMRGNPRIDNRASVARIGVLHVGVPAFDGIHFSDPNAGRARVDGGTVLVSGGPRSSHQPVGPGSRQLNEPSTAYVGGGRVLFFGRESTVPEPDQVRYGRLVFSRFDVATRSWEHKLPQHLPWSPPEPLTAAAAPRPPHSLHGTPEVVSLRSPDDDSYRAVIFQQIGPPGNSLMATAMLDDVAEAVPTLIPDQPVVTSLSRASGAAIYGFRVMFDNGIYYLHYNDGPQVPDWPERFVLAAALDPYAGPWAVNAETTHAESTYFRRGEPFDPDNGAIWQGTMFKHRGHYYLYYENYHAVDDVDQAYQDYAHPQAGSRVGFATA